MSVKFYIKIISFISFNLCLLFPQIVISQDIRVGMSTALTGPASDLGNGVKDGVEAYFNMVNKNGGINGANLKLISLDDSYEPDKAAINMRDLYQKGVVAVIGNVGTPTAVVSVPIAKEKKMLLFGAYTGAGILRENPPNRYIVNYRASYEQETQAMISALLNKGIKPEEIAFFTQNDGYGDAGYNGALKALKAKGYDKGSELPHGRYERNTTNVEEGLSVILDSDIEPKAIIMVGAYAPCAKFIKLAKQDFDDVLYLNVSFVGSIPLMKALGSESEGVIVSQVVPHYKSNLPAAIEYRKIMSEYGNNNKGFVSFEGYMIGKLFVEGLKRIKGDINRESIINGIESINNYDAGINMNINYSPSNHQALSVVWPTIIKGKEFVSISWDKI